MLKYLYSLFQRTKRTILRRIFWSPNERQSGKKLSLFTFDCITLPKHSQLFIVSSGSISNFSLDFQKYYFLIGLAGKNNIASFFLSLSLSRSTALSLALRKFGRLFIGYFFLNLQRSNKVPRSAKSFKLYILMISIERILEAVQLKQNIEKKESLVLCYLSIFFLVSGYARLTS